MKDTVMAYLLENSIKFKGKPNPKAAMGKILGENPDLRSKVKEVNQVISEVVKEIETMSLEEQQAKLDELAPEGLGQKTERKRKEIELKNVKGTKSFRTPPYWTRKSIRTKRLFHKKIQWKTCSKA